MKYELEELLKIFKQHERKLSAWNRAKKAENPENYEHYDDFNLPAAFVAIIKAIIDLNKK